MARFQQLLLIGTFLPLCWLAMMATHELGHVLGAYISGGRVSQVVLHPLTISRTDLAHNPHPLLVVQGRIGAARRTEIETAADARVAAARAAGAAAPIAGRVRA